MCGLPAAFRHRAGLALVCVDILLPAAQTQVGNHMHRVGFSVLFVGLMRWISSTVAVQRSVVFSKKKTRSCVVSIEMLHPLLQASVSRARRSVMPWLWNSHAVSEDVHIEERLPVSCLPASFRLLLRDQLCTGGCRVYCVRVPIHQLFIVDQM